MEEKSLLQNCALCKTPLLTSYRYNTLYGVNYTDKLWWCPACDALNHILFVSSDTALVGTQDDCPQCPSYAKCITVTPHSGG